MLRLSRPEPDFSSSKPNPKLSASLSPIQIRNQKHHFKFWRNLNKKENEFSHPQSQQLEQQYLFIQPIIAKSLSLTENLDFASASGPIEAW